MPDALSGIAVILSARTGKVLFPAVRISYVQSVIQQKGEASNQMKTITNFAGKITIDMMLQRAWKRTLLLTDLEQFYHHME